jgi:hypothetical protein
MLLRINKLNKTRKIYVGQRGDAALTNINLRFYEIRDPNFRDELKCEREPFAFNVIPLLSNARTYIGAS